MAIFQFNMQLIGRSGGHSAVAAAAYRSGQKLRNDYTGTIEDYTKKNWIRYSEVMLPENAPSSYKERQTLWNAVEAAEKGRNARLAREIEVALPVELTAEENIRLIRSFVQENFVKDGMIADVNIHCPPVRDKNGIPLDKDGFPALKKEDMIFRNPHAHILLTVRPMDEKGHWKAKTQKEYLCKKGDETTAFTAEEFKAARKEGWEKQYQYYKGKQKVWRTPSEAFVENLKRVSKNPRSTPYGRRDEKTGYWNSPDALIQYRKSWEAHVNRALEAAGRPERVSSLSYEARGMDTIAGVHLGSHAGKDSVRYRLNEEIKALNRANKAIREKIEVLEAQIHEKSVSFSDALAKQLASLEASIVSAKYTIEALETEQQTLEKDIRQLTHSTGHIKEVHESFLLKNHTDQKEITRLTAMQKAAASASERGLLQEEIGSRQENIRIRKEHFKKLLTEEGFKNFSDYREQLEKLEQAKKLYGQTAQAILAQKQDIDRYTNDFKELCQYLPTDRNDFERFRKKREEVFHSYIQKLSFHLPPLSQQAESFRRIVRDTRYSLNRTMTLAAKTKHLLSELEPEEDGRKPYL